MGISENVVLDEELIRGYVVLDIIEVPWCNTRRKIKVKVGLVY